jgi:light-harvesting complex 1 beta chain
MAYQHIELQSRASGKPRDGMHLIVAVTFVGFVVLAFAGLLLTLNWRTWLPGAEGARSMWQGVTSAVYTAVSHLS